MAVSGFDTSRVARLDVGLCRGFLATSEGVSVVVPRTRTPFLVRTLLVD
jgi:hypothetical protein